MSSEHDLALLDAAFDAPVPPSPEVRAHARAALQAHAAERALPARRPRGRGPRLAAAAGLAVVAAAAVTVAVDLTGTESGDGSRSILRGVPSASAKVLERAATRAEHRSFTAPRDNQWIFTEDRLTSSDGGEPYTRTTWRRADGGGVAILDDDGKLHVDRMGRAEPKLRRAATFDSYKAVAALPADPDALLAWAYRLTRNITGAGSTEHAEAFAVLRSVLQQGVLPPELEAAAFRAMKRVPGVTVDTTDVLGEPALALGLTDEWLRQELLLDPQTYAYRGQRSTVVKDATIDPLKAGNDTGRVTKGHTVVAVRVAAGVVDEPGERP